MKERHDKTVLHRSVKGMSMNLGKVRGAVSIVGDVIEMVGASNGLTKFGDCGPAHVVCLFLHLT